MPGRNLGKTVTASISPFLPFPFPKEWEREESGIARAGLLPFLPAIPGGKESGTASPRRHAPLRVASPRERESRNWPPERPGRRPQAQQPRGNATDATPSRLAPAPLRRLLPPARHVRCTGGSGARGQSKTRQPPADTPHLGGAHTAARHASANAPCPVSSGAPSTRPTCAGPPRSLRRGNTHAGAYACSSTCRQPYLTGSLRTRRHGAWEPRRRTKPRTKTAGYDRPASCCGSDGIRTRDLGLDRAAC